ncbi:hypothetical protein AJ79_08181 [Helicocarpus griseus UAMH5409]|uniref:protein-tyrosine-phosphatase n=1 Tax=Helicocarpus griseus UAMH5409 TaxID=1447875 RepID=A0A2B7WV81_9EURO|nr:hypothetical protein AJ79_08181 [Helicocarpus griseus UAMH5409]
MSATTAAMPSPQAWSPGATTISTTPLGMPPKTPASVGQMTAPILGSGPSLSPRLLRDSGNSYFGIIDYSSAHLPNSAPGMHPRKSWNLPSGSPNGGKHNHRYFSEHNFEFEGFGKQLESSGYVAGHRTTSSFERQTQALRDLDRQSEEKRGRQSPVSPHAVDVSRTRSQYEDKASYMDIDPHPDVPKIEAEFTSTSIRKPTDISAASTPAAPIPHLITPRGPDGDNRPFHITLPPHAGGNSLAVNRSRPLRRSETSPACVDNGNVTFVDPHICKDALDSSSDATLLLDVRPFPQFAQARIKGALNLCIPTTLLKRPTFNPQKLEDTFAAERDKKKFARWRSSTRIVVYDASTTLLKDSSTLVNVLKKFTNEGWKGEPMMLRGGFAKFSAEFPQFVETHQPNEPANLNGQQRSISLALPNKNCIAGGCAIPKSSPAVHPFFSNIRQNMDLIDGVGQMPIKLPQKMTEKARQMLPQWLRRASDAGNEGRLISQTFLQIERAEQNRMQEALSGNVSYGSPVSSTPSPNKAFRIAGLEKGSKNRYNNIYPYDHSRVRLQGVPNGNCDYVNASFIQSSRTNKKYIATQAPIPATFNDFWRVVWEQDIRVIVMLTAESEGPQLKCHPYWKTSEYGPMNLKIATERRIPLGSPSPQTRRASGQRRATNPHTAGEKLDAQKEQQGTGEAPSVIVRHLTLSHSSYPFQPIREITQLQYSHWPDFGAPAQPAHLVRLIEECNQICNTANGRTSRAETLKPEEEGQRRVLVHCSAGCGRTGTFCTVDSVVDMLKQQRMASMEGQKSSEQGNWLHRDDIDLIATTVEDFRLQRLSMVQSLKQFVLCYESVLEWIALHESELGDIGVDSSDPLKLRGGDHRPPLGVGREGFRRSYHE